METEKALDIASEFSKKYTDRVKKLALEMGLELKKTATEKGFKQNIPFEDRPNVSEPSSDWIAIRNQIEGIILLEFQLNFSFFTTITDPKYLKQELEKLKGLSEL
jgi:hypothetical protein